MDRRGPGPDAPDRERQGGPDPERPELPIRGLRYPRSARLRGREEIRNAFRRGKRRRTSHLDVFFLPSPASRCRYGVVVPKHGHTIVERNRLRRRLRELGRVEALPKLWHSGHVVDMLVRARAEAYGASFDELRGEIIHVTDEICSGRSS